MIAGVLFARCNLGLALGTGYVLANLFFDGLAFLFCVFLAIDDKSKIKSALINPATIWLVIFAIIVFVYGHYHIRYAADYYSRQYMILTMFPAILIMFIIIYNKKNMLDILSVSGTIVIITSLITSLIYDDVWTEWLDGMASRVGATPAGTCTDTGNLVLVLLIPIMYQVIVNRRFKQYLWITLVGIFEIVATGSKSSVLPIVFVLAIMLLGASDDKKIVVRNLIILIVLAVVAVVAVMTIPALYSIIGDRIVEMFSGITSTSTDYDLHTSTGQRMAVIAAFKEHFMEYPIFGHGFYAFKEMAYSALEEYHKDGETLYRHIQIHMNYLELLFSFGIFGFIAYYWFPVYEIIKTFKANKMAKLIVFSLMISFFFMDLGIDMYYKYMLPYYSYLMAYCFIKNDSDQTA